jgi:uncharacterized membrane protein YqaE (UPF0057 family)
MPDFFGVGRFFSAKFTAMVGCSEVTELNPDERQRSISCVAHASQLQIRSCPMDFIRIIIAILLPPLGVFLQVGFAGAFWLNILLTLCGYIPGIVHAVYIIAKR